MDGILAAHSELLGGVGVPSHVAFVVFLNWFKHTYHRNEVPSGSGCVLEFATFVFN